MKKQKVKENLYKIRMDIIDQIEEPNEVMEKFIFEHQKDSFEYGYKVGMSWAAMILLDKIYEMFPEEKEDEEPGRD